MHDPREILDRPTPPADLTVGYGTGADHVVDVYLPRRNGAAPVVLLLHGGFWRAEFDRAHLGPLARALAGQGFAICLPEFRRTGQRDGGWPGTFDDVARLVDDLPELVSAELSENRLDPTRLVLAGHSAGGHLALWVAGRHHLPASAAWARSGPLPVRGVIAMAAVSDLVRCSEWGLDGDAVEELLGGTPAEQAERYALANPAGHLPLGVPTTLVHGREDDRVPVAMSREYARAARATGDQATLKELPGSGHYALIDPLSSAWPAVLAAFQARVR